MELEQIAGIFFSPTSGPLLFALGVIVVIVWLIVKTKKAVSTVWPFIRKLVTVVEDLFGTEDRPGVPARPGLMARMAASEEANEHIKITLAEHTEALLELRPNHGGSMKDLVRSISDAQKELKDAFESHVKSLGGTQEVTIVNNVPPTP